eukprot:jgi/Phyca11/537582/estExt2_fgenesh1_pg.C_PHYCAscaffold_1000003
MTDAGSKRSLEEGERQLTVATFDCNGKRDRTKFVGLKTFTDADLSSDFFFLEEVSRSTNSAARSRSQLNANARRYTSNKKRKVESSAPINPDIPADCPQSVAYDVIETVSSTEPNSVEQQTLPEEAEEMEVEEENPNMTKKLFSISEEVEAPVQSKSVLIEEIPAH